MPETKPWIIEPDELDTMLGDESIVIVDVSNQESYIQGHIPNAVFLNYKDIILNKPPVFGMLPDSDHLSSVLSNLGIKKNSYVIAYDEEGGGKASRLLWTLDIAGHKQKSLLNGGIVAWKIENKSIVASANLPLRSNYKMEIENTNIIANKEYLLAQLDNPNGAILDTRSANEFNGTDKRAERAGHIPGAVNIDWLSLKDTQTQKLLENSRLSELLAAKEITQEKEIIVHCHSHHRSALTYVALKHLGYPQVRGYPGSWSEWGNDPTTPIVM